MLNYCYGLIVGSANHERNVSEKWEGYFTCGHE